MADLSTVRGKIQDALDEADAALAQPTTSAQLAALQAQVAQLTSDLASANAKIDAARAAAQADKDADAANVAGQGVLDALA